MARRRKNGRALDEALDGGEAPPSEAGEAMATVMRRRAEKAGPLAELGRSLESLLAQARADGADLEALKEPLEAALTEARQIEAKAQVIAHLSHALDHEDVETTEQLADHVAEALHAIEGS